MAVGSRTHSPTRTPPGMYEGSRPADEVTGSECSALPTAQTLMAPRYPAVPTALREPLPLRRTGIMCPLADDQIAEDLRVRRYP